MANEELIERLRHDSAYLVQHGYKRFSGNIDAAITALEAAEDDKLSARHSLYVEVRESLKSRGYNVSKLAGRQEKLSQSDVIGDVARALEAAESKAKGPTREEIHDMLIQHMDEPEAEPILNRLFGDEKEGGR